MPKVIVDLEDYISVNEAAEYLGIGVATVWRWLKSGKLTPVRMIGRTLVSKKQVEELKGQNESN